VFLPDILQPRSSSKILAALLSRNLSLNFLDRTLGEENSKMEKEKILSGKYKLVFPISNEFFFQNQGEMVQKLSRNSIMFFLQCRIYINIEASWCEKWPSRCQ
jgi:hypothetical protein